MSQSLYEEIKREKEKLSEQYKWKQYLGKAFLWMLLGVLVTLVIAYVIPVKFCSNYHITVRAYLGVMQPILLVVNLTIFYHIMQLGSVSLKSVIGWYFLNCLLYSIVLVPLFNEKQTRDYYMLGIMAIIFLLCICLGVIFAQKKIIIVVDEIGELLDLIEFSIFLLVFFTTINVMTFEILDIIFQIIICCIIVKILIVIVMGIIKDSKTKKPTSVIVYSCILHNIFLSMIAYL